MIGAHGAEVVEQLRLDRRRQPPRDERVDDTDRPLDQRLVLRDLVAGGCCGVDGDPQLARDPKVGRELDVVGVGVGAGCGISANASAMTTTDAEIARSAPTMNGNGLRTRR